MRSDNSNKNSNKTPESNKKTPKNNKKNSNNSNNNKGINTNNRNNRNNTNNKKRNAIVPDTSVLIEGLLSKAIKRGELQKPTVIIHEASLAELEHQANKGQEKGYLGLDEVGALQALSSQGHLTLSFKGVRPGEYEILEAKRGSIDAMIRELAAAEEATLWTADNVQATVARAKGLQVHFHEMVMEREMEIESFFDETTMSVHIKEECSIKSKRGRPGQWSFVNVREEPATQEELERWAKQIVETAHVRKDGFVEIERPGSTICQVGKYRIVITRPPFSDGHEITAVRPVKHLSLEDYKLSTKLKERLDAHAEGLLIAGSPGHGKSTFAQALAEHYATRDKIIKTVEAPRDLILAKDITQYAMSHGSPEEIHDILLLSRPDYTIFDEMRNTDDFSLFADMRLSGVGMIGVLHATKPIDAIQRFLGRIELGVIPHVVDTVIFIKDGNIGAIYSIQMAVKVPSGMTEADLARPIVEVHDFESGKLVFELYTYGEQTVVIPTHGEKRKESPVNKFIARGIKEHFQNWTPNVEVEMEGTTKAHVYVPEEMIGDLIGRGGERIRKIEEELGVKIELNELPDHYAKISKRRNKEKKEKKEKKRGKKSKRGRR